MVQAPTALNDVQLQQYAQIRESLETRLTELDSNTRQLAEDMEKYPRDAVIRRSLEHAEKSANLTIHEILRNLLAVERTVEKDIRLRLQDLRVGTNRGLIYTLATGCLEHIDSGRFDLVQVLARRIKYFFDHDLTLRDDIADEAGFSGLTTLLYRGNWFIRRNVIILDSLRSSMRLLVQTLADRTSDTHRNMALEIAVQRLRDDEAIQMLLECGARWTPVLRIPSETLVNLNHLIHDVREAGLMDYMPEPYTTICTPDELVKERETVKLRSEMTIDVVSDESLKEYEDIDAKYTRGAENEILTRRMNDLQEFLNAQSAAPAGSKPPPPPAQLALNFVRVPSYVDDIEALYNMYGNPDTTAATVLAITDLAVEPPPVIVFLFQHAVMHGRITEAQNILNLVDRVVPSKQQVHIHAHYFILNHYCTLSYLLISLFSFTCVCC